MYVNYYLIGGYIFDFRCPGFTYKCEYGACVIRDAECDGKIDCADGSDERSPNCKSKEETTSNCKYV